MSIKLSEEEKNVAHQKWLEEQRIKAKEVHVRIGRELLQTVLAITGDASEILKYISDDSLERIFEDIESLMIDEGYSNCDDCEQKISADREPRYNEGFD